jgi:hypothetical protein
MRLGPGGGAPRAVHLARYVGFALGLALGVGALAGRAHAQQRVIPEARIESVRGVALGTGARASAVSTQAATDNPANLPLGGLYHIEAFMGYQPQLKRLSFGGSVVDSMTSRLAAGLSLRGFAGDNDAGENSGWEGRLGLGFPFGDMFSIGIAGRFSNYTVSDPHAVPEPRPPGATGPVDQTFKLHRVFTMDAAMTLRPTEGFAISALAYNLIDTESALAPLTVGGSAAFTFDSALTLGGDVLVDLNTHDSFGGAKLTGGGGLEYLASGVVPLRGGVLYDQGRKQTSVTAGIGFVETNFGIQVGLRQSVSGYRESTVMAALQYFVQ